jgi:hypothetical protein
MYSSSTMLSSRHPISHVDEESLSALLSHAVRFPRRAPSHLAAIGLAAVSLLNLTCNSPTLTAPTGRYSVVASKTGYARDDATPAVAGQPFEVRLKKGAAMSLRGRRS